ncbi:hypothetical protein EMCRGX_G034493 [Ephydatia muelleri]|eukprot:Em0023g405a
MGEKNYKGLLQELFQKNQGQSRPPEYREIEKTGDPHMPVYTILLTAVLKGRELSVKKKARKRQDAEKEAAKEMYEMIFEGVPASSAPQCSSIASPLQVGGNDNAKSDLQELVQKQTGHPVPQYELLHQSGPSHQPTFRVKVTAPWNGEELVEEGQGNTKKAADKNAAERLLLRIRGRKQPPLPPLSGDNMSSSAEETPIDAKNKLQEILQKRGYPIPTYDVTDKDGPSHEPTFTVTLTVRNRAKKVVYKKKAEASQRKEAEKLCALIALPEVEQQLDEWSDEEFQMPQSPSPEPEAPTPPQQEIHWEFDKKQLGILAKFTDHQPGVWCVPAETCGTFLCLVSVQAKDDDCHVVAQGSGTTPSDAVQCGMGHLLRNMKILYPH